jgi:O-antigen ligase
MYNGHVAPHCHNIYIDSVASYGIVGTITILYYAFRCVLPNILKARKEDVVKYGIIISVLLIYLIHGTLDCTFNVLGTAGLALMLACCPSMKENS